MNKLKTNSKSLLSSRVLVSQVRHRVPAAPWGLSVRGAVKTLFLLLWLVPRRMVAVMDQECTLPCVTWEVPPRIKRKGLTWKWQPEGAFLAGEQGSQNGPNSRSPLPSPQACFVKRTLMTVPGGPTASMGVSAWTRSGATAAAACPALLESGARGTSTSACPTPAAPRAAWTAFSSPTTTCASAAAPTQVGLCERRRALLRGRSTRPASVRPGSFLGLCSEIV